MSAAAPSTGSAASVPASPAAAGADGDRRRVLASRVSMAFARAAHWTSEHCGRPTTFAVAVLVILVWAVTGPVFHYSDTWQLIINTGTTIITFLMVFLIQNTQNRDSAVLHLKLDELIRATEGARNRLLDLEGVSDAELDQLKRAFARLAGDTPCSTLEAAMEDLEAAGEDIHDAKAKIRTMTDGPGPR